MNGLKNEVRAKIIGYILAGLGLVAGLAWNEAIKGLIEWAFPLERNTIGAQFVYAAIITIVVVVIGAYLAKATPDKTS